VPCVLTEVAVPEQRVVRSLLHNPTPLNNKLNVTQVGVLLEEALAQVPALSWNNLIYVHEFSYAKSIANYTAFSSSATAH